MKRIGYLLRFPSQLGIVGITILAVLHGAGSLLCTV